MISTDPEQKSEQINPSIKKGSIYFLDLSLIIILSILSVVFILIPPYNETFLRKIIPLLLIFLIPGYLLMSVMFPGRNDLKFIERFTLSVVFSIAIFVFNGFALNYTPWGFRPYSIAMSLSIINCILLLFAFIQRIRLREKGYGISINEIISSYKNLRIIERKEENDNDPVIEKTLIKALIISIIIVSAMLIYATYTRETEKFTALYILGPDGKAEGYPKEIKIGEPTTILAGVENYETTPVNYSLSVNLGGSTLKEEPIVLNNGEKWLQNITFIPQLTSATVFAGTNKQKLEFQLKRNQIIYRTVHLFVNVSSDTIKFAEFPELINGNMESDYGWIFSNSSSSAGGGYNYTSNSSSRAYEINFTGQEAVFNGMIYQNLTTVGYARATLNFDVKDSVTNASYYIQRQVLLDDKMIWQSPAGGKNDSWEHISVPILLSGNNTLAFRVTGNYVTGQNITVWFDNVELMPYGRENISITKMRPKPGEHEFNFNIRGEPHQINKSIQIDGSSFPGFYYNLDENKSYEGLDFEISEDNKIDAGKATYISRPYGDELHLMGSRYKILSKDNSSINISRVDIPLNKTLKFGEIWTFGNYSLSVKLISSKGDSAMLELKNAGNTQSSTLVNLKGIYEYKTRVGKITMPVLRARLDSINEDEVYLNDIEISPDDLLTLKPETYMRDFEVANVSSDEIIFKNSFPIDLTKKTAILDGSAGLLISGNLIYPYASNVQLRGTPQNINFGNWMNITGFNYPGYSMENDTSYEEMRMYFSGNGLVDPGQARYETRVYSGKISYLGNIYELVYPDRPGYISNITNKSTLIISNNETQSLNGYVFSFNETGDNKIRLNIRKSMSKDKQDLLNRLNGSNVTFFPDVNYEVVTGQPNNLRKSNTLGMNDTFEYWEEFRIDQMYKKIAGELISRDNDSVEMNIRFYDIPFGIFPGKAYGEFEVYSIDSNSIVIKNTKPLYFKPGTETSILGGALKIRTSANDLLAYPVK